MVWEVLLEIKAFQSTSPARGTTRRCGCRHSPLHISIHVPREGDDSHFSAHSGQTKTFQSTSPARGTTSGVCRIGNSLVISIHVPREGDDEAANLRRWQERQFQSTSPARGTTFFDELGRMTLENFNPRPPRGGRRFPFDFPLMHRRNFNPRPPRGGRRAPCATYFYSFMISIHVPREGDDPIVLQMDGRQVAFQSTSPARGTTGQGYRQHQYHNHFNPRPPRGGRHSPIDHQ